MARYCTIEHVVCGRFVDCSGPACPYCPLDPHVCNHGPSLVRRAVYQGGHPMIEMRVEMPIVSFGSEPQKRLNMNNITCPVCKLHVDPLVDPFYIRLEDGVAGGQVQGLHVECRDKEVRLEAARTASVPPYRERYGPQIHHHG